jgi:hypothetical protein
MALNLSTLTNASTSATVLAEAQTTADFLDSVPILKNIARGSNKGGDGKQTTALNQPKALPLIDGKGYLYLSGVSGNYASIPDPIGALGDFTLQVDGLDAGAVRPASDITLMAQYEAGKPTFILQMGLSGSILFNLYDGTNEAHTSVAAVPTDTVGIRVTRVGTLITYWVDTGSGYVSHDTDTSVGTVLNNWDNALEIGSYNSGASQLLTGKISRAVIWDNGTATGTPVLDVDFTATNIRHGDTKFQCATGQTVTINQSGTDPATVIKKSVLRFDGVNDGLQGLFANNIDGGYMFAAFSVLGDGGESWARVFTTSLAGSGTDYNGTGAGFALRNSATTGLFTLASGLTQIQTGMFDDANGDILYEVKLKNSEFTTKLNNAGFLSATHDGTIDSDQFNIGQDFVSTQNGAIDLEYLALFPATITDAEAARVVNYINNRNTVFDLKDSLGHYFYDGAKSPVGNITDVATWNGRIVGSDNGDADKLATQATSTAQPVGDGYKVTFADNTDFLTIPSTTQAGWQVVGTSLGTFAYRVNGTNAVTELNLLGNLGHASFRKAGDLYGIILLPETANGKEIEDARKLLIDRGAADGTTSTNLYTYWYTRNDIFEFKYVNTSSVTEFTAAWYGCPALTSFPALDMSSGANFTGAWQNCIALTTFPALDMSSGTAFTSAWQGCTALTSFPAGAKLGTAVENVNFTSAWNASGLTSFPALDLSNGNNFSSAFKLSQLTSFPEDILLGTNSTAVRFDGCWENCSGLTSFPNIDLSEGRVFNGSWYQNANLVDFPALFTNWNPSTVTSSVFHAAWQGCGSLSSTSVENILTSIDSSGVFGTYTGLVTGTALADAGIDIDYNVATGALSAATNTAIASLKGKGWVITVNGTTL